MNIYQDRFTKKYYGNYRAKIIEVDETLKNGIYKVRVYPMMAEILDEYLPLAQSNLTTEEKHINLYVNDWVWVFFENGDQHYPIIWNRCNIKDNYPNQATGDSPDYYNDILADSDIDESSVSYNGTYNKVSGFDFPPGDNAKIHLEIDEENGQFILISDNWQIIFDKDKKGHLKFADIFIKTDTKCNIHAGSNKIKIDAAGISLVDGNANTVEMVTGFVKINGTALTIST